jgi:hypothetical protein
MSTLRTVMERLTNIPVKVIRLDFRLLARVSTFGVLGVVVSERVRLARIETANYISARKWMLKHAKQGHITLARFGRGWSQSSDGPITALTAHSLGATKWHGAATISTSGSVSLRRISSWMSSCSAKPGGSLLSRFALLIFSATRSERSRASSGLMAASGM